MGDLTGQQQVALREMRANHGTAGSMKGVYSVPVTLRALARRGLVRQIGDGYELTRQGWAAELRLKEKTR